jgi:enoyl-CoA hydratase
MGFETLLIEDQGPARIITINRPDKLNALDPQVIGELIQAVEAAGAEGLVRGVIITGAGKAFVAGADIETMANMGADEAKAFASQGHALGSLIAKLSKVVIAAVNGFALGGGCEVALACDFIYASEKARFGQPEVKLGVIPGFGGTQRMIRRVGMAQALELCTVGNIIKADEALRIGLVNKVVEPDKLLATAVQTIETIATMGPLAVAKAKQVIHRGAQTPLDEANQMEVDAFADLFNTADQKEGMKAFIEKRPAEYKGN